VRWAEGSVALGTAKASKAQKEKNEAAALAAGAQRRDRGDPAASAAGARPKGRVARTGADLAPTAALAAALLALGAVFRRRSRSGWWPTR
jgi:uncharacterized protein (TIGR03382 family)